MTASGNDVTRVDRFITNFYFGALGRAPSDTELQQHRALFLAAGGQGQAALLEAVLSLGQQLFDLDDPNSEYNQRERTDEQFASDICFAYLQRAPQLSGGVGLVDGQEASRTSLRDGVGNAENAEFAAIVSTLYGSSDGSGSDRVTRYLSAMYLVVPDNGRDFESDRETLQAAAADGKDAVISAAKLISTDVFQGWLSSKSSVSDEEFAAGLFHAFLQREASAGEVSDWVEIIQSKDRNTALQSFANLPATEELAGTLYREILWLTTDHLGTPRMISERSGSLAGIRRHDYLPFGEEIGGPQVALLGGRTTTQGYTADSTRQHFTGYEVDAETGLNFAQARYQSSIQGRFTSVDPLGASASVGDPQSFNRYSYVNNNPTNLTDPSGMQAYDASNSFTDGAGSLEAQPFNPNRSHFGGPAVLFAAGLFHGVGVMAASQGSSGQTQGSSGQHGSGMAGTEGKAGRVNRDPASVAPPFDSLVDGSPTYTEQNSFSISIPFSTLIAAGIDAEQTYNPDSIRENLEYAGWICELGDGSFVHSVGPASGRTPTHADKGWCPCQTVGPAADWHTHSATDPKLIVGGIDRNETFSDPDRRINSGSRMNGFLGTPHGKILMFIPAYPGTPSTEGQIITFPERTKVP